MASSHELYTKLANAAEETLLSRLAALEVDAVKTAGRVPGPGAARAATNVMGAAADTARGVKSTVKTPGLWGRVADVFTGSKSKQMGGMIDKAHHNLAEAGRRNANMANRLRNYDQVAEQAARKQWWDGTGKAMAGVGAAGLVAAPGAYAVGRHQGQKNKKRDRNMAYGAGMATGLAAPGMAQAAAGRAQQLVNRFAPPGGQPGGYPQGGGY